MCTPEMTVGKEDNKSLEGFLLGASRPIQGGGPICWGRGDWAQGPRVFRDTPQLLSLHSQQWPDSCVTRCRHRFIFALKTVPTNKLRASFTSTAPQQGTREGVEVCGPWG